ncbi:DHS-like NAD/FAD-binding domain-containing protein, partial [Peniophora sp. CONT]
MVTSLDLAAADLPTRRALEGISLAVAKSKRIVVVTGAGISCSCGIPDFRSSDGLYNLVKKQYPNVVMKGRDLFDATLFRDADSTAVFYTFISELKRSIDAATPSPTHDFIKTLDTKKKLLRSYTQNIDGLEERAGLVGSSAPEARAAPSKGSTAAGKLRVKGVRNVQLHGDIHRVRCTFCSVDLPCTEEHLRLFGVGQAPDCPECAFRAQERVARSARPIKIGTLRPAIVLYDEPHPLGDDIGVIQTSDLSRRPDLLVIMGTSLKVHGLRRLVREFAKAVHAGAPEGKPSTYAYKVVFVNKTPPGSEWSGVIDYHVGGETDAWAGRVLDDWKRVRPADWEVQQTLDGDGVFRHVKDGAAGTGKGKAKKPFSIVAAGPENIPPSQADPASLSGTKPAPPATPKRRKSVSHYEVGGGSPSKRRELEPLRIEFTPGGMEAFGQGLEKTLFANKTNSKVVADSQERRGRGRPKGSGKAKAVEGKAKPKGVKRTASSVDTPRRAQAAPPANRRKVEVSLQPSKLKRAASTVGMRSSQRMARQKDIEVDVDVDVFS